MTKKIFKINLGICNCYLIKSDNGYLLVDSGSQGPNKGFLKNLKRLAIRPEEVSLLFLTHGHWDHMAGAKMIKKATGCKVAINQREKVNVESGEKFMPPGFGLWGKGYRTALNAALPMYRYQGCEVDISLSDDGCLLEEFGVAGRIIHTPGHSAGSMSLLLDTGEAFVGDLAVNGAFMRIGPGRPIFGDSIDLIFKNWELLLESGATKIFPAHGDPFNSSLLAKQI